VGGSSWQLASCQITRCALLLLRRPALVFDMCYISMGPPVVAPGARRAEADALGVQAEAGALSTQVVQVASGEAPPSLLIPASLHARYIRCRGVWVGQSGCGAARGCGSRRTARRTVTATTAMAATTASPISCLSLQRVAVSNKKVLPKKFRGGAQK
jgi:hypothetical protein